LSAAASESLWRYIIVAASTSEPDGEFRHRTTSTPFMAACRVQW